MWIVPFLVAVAAVELVLNSPLENVWLSVFPFLAEPQGYGFDAIFGSREIQERLEGVFGSWVANGVLFGLYHVHQPWGKPNSVITGLLYTFPAYRYRSTWMSFILHSAQSVYLTFLVLGVVLGLA